MHSQIATDTEAADTRARPRRAGPIYPSGFSKALALAVAAALLLVVPTAQAQPIDCSSHVLDATASGGIATAQVSKQVAMLQDIYPDVNVYAQAYEHLPGGSMSAFKDLARQCGNWRSKSSDRFHDNLLVVVYGRDVDRVGMIYGHGLDSAVEQRELDEIMNAVNSSLGSNLSHVNPDYATTAIVDALRGTQSMLADHLSMQSKLWHTNITVFEPEPYVDPNSTHEDPDPRQIAMIMFYIVLGSALVFGLQKAASALWTRR